jgi:site-specific recombinase XerD
MGIFERPRKSGVWWISYNDGAGARHREKIGRRDVARVKYDERRREVKEGRYTPPRSAGRTLSFRELAAAAMDNKKLRLASRSYETDKQRLSRILPRIGGVPADNVTNDQVEDLLAGLRHGGLCGSTANRYRSLLGSIYNYGVRTGRVRANPVMRVKRFKENEHRVRWLRADEENALREVIRANCPDHEPELDLALYTGMRRGEQFTLKWKDVDLERGILTVHGKTGRRFIIANSSAKAAIERLSLKRETGENYVCRDATADTQRDWRRWLESAAKKAGIDDFHWHDLRHTFASRLVMAGVDLRTVQELLGHKSILMTMRYAHLSPDHRQAAAEKIGGTEVRI